MSATITRMVLAKRQNEALMARRDAIIAAAKGADGDAGPMPDHEWNGTKLRFEKPDGSWGEWVDLKGKPGAKGDDGKRVFVVGGSGGGASSLNALQPGIEGSDPSSVVVMQGGEWVRLPWAAFVTTIAGALDMGANSRRIDFVSETVMYRGEAAPGADEAALVWRIKRVEFDSDGDVTEKWAEGSAEYVHAWADRASLNYL